MIRKLRIKIVLVIVLVAAVMLGVIFGMSYTMTRQDLRAQSISMMQAIAANPFEPIPPGQSRQVRLPYFVLRTDAFGNLVAIGSTDYDLTDRSFLRAVAAAASASEADIGEIPAYHLRFCRVDGSVIFADISSEQQTLQGLVRSSLLIGGGSLLALIGLAILLARWAVRPVETAWRQQKQFVADASHELKTPLTVILTNTELLQSPDYDEAQKQQFTDGIRTMAQQMRALVESLLELARYEKTPLPETGAGLPLLTLAEVEGAGYRRAAEAAPNVRDDVNQLVQTWTPGAPLGLSAWEAGYADGTQDTVYLVQRYCRLSGAGGAKAFGRGLARRLWLLEPEEYTVLKETPDTLVLANYEDGPGFHQT